MARMAQLRRRIGLVLSWMVFLSAARAQAPSPTTLTVAAVDPKEAAVLGYYDELYVAINYTTAQPFRLRTHAFFHGQPVPVLTQASPRHGPGSGQALAFAGCTKAAELDELRFTAEDNATGQTLATATLAVEARWTGVNSPQRPIAAWARSLAASEQARITADINGKGGPTGLLGTALLQLMFLCVPGYFILQWWMLRRTNGGLKTAAGIVAGAFGLLLTLVIFSCVRGSNLAPILLVFACPAGCLSLLAIGFLQRRKNRRPPPANNQPGRL